MTIPRLKPANLIYPAQYPAALADRESDHADHLDDSGSESGSEEIDINELYQDHGAPVGQSLAGKARMWPDQYGRLVEVCQHCGGHGEGHCRACGGSGETFAG